MSFHTVHPSWCEISPDIIEQNLVSALALLPEKTRFCAVLKANAYGHGIDNVVPALLRHGVSHIGIVSNNEAHSVREAGFKGVVMRLRSASPQEMKEAIRWQVEEQVSTVETARYIQRLGSQAGLHLSLNAGGMSRDGLELHCVEGRTIAREILSLCADRITGICTHYPSNMTDKLLANSKQFHEDSDWIIEQGQLDRSRLLLHAGSSLTLIAKKRPETDMFRCGAILFGILKPDLGFRPAMQLKARITSISCYPAGFYVGYDNATQLQRNSRLASISIGYANGIGRHWVDRTSVLVNKAHVPVLGKISMNVIIADVTDMPGAQIGDEVVIFGQQGEKSIDLPQAEFQGNTIMAELYTDWGQRNPVVTTR